MEGWRAVTTDDHKVGTVVAEVDDFVIVEHGMLRKSRHAVPKAFVHYRPESEEICLSLPKDMLEESPKVENGVEFDELHMRSGHDRRSDARVKAEIGHALSQRFTVRLAVDDRTEVVEVWREAGLATAHVTPEGAVLPVVWPPGQSAEPRLERLLTGSGMP